MSIDFFVGGLHLPLSLTCGIQSVSIISDESGMGFLCPATCSRGGNQPTAPENDTSLHHMTLHTCSTGQRGYKNMKKAVHSIDSLTEASESE